MVKKRQRPDYGRTFSKLENWDEFLSLWEKASTEEEAIGLLYGATSLELYSVNRVWCPNHTQHCSQSQYFDRIVDFYTLWADHSNHNVSRVAEQMIVKSWLRVAGREAGNIHFVGIHLRLLFFLETKRNSLLRPPYPRFVADYLFKLNQALTPRLVEECEEFAEIAHSMVLPLLQWGLAHYIASDAIRYALYLHEIKEFLNERDYDLANVLLYNDDRRPRRLSLKICP